MVHITPTFLYELQINIKVSLGRACTEEQIFIPENITLKIALMFSYKTDMSMSMSVLKALQYLSSCMSFHNRSRQSSRERYS